MTESNNSHVIVVDITMRFWSMVVFMVRSAIATIPVMIILVAIAGILVGLRQSFFWGTPPHAI